MKKILLIDGDNENAIRLKSKLYQQGYWATLCFDGLNGKKLILTQQFDVVVSEIVVPFLDGFQLCKVLKEVCPSASMIILTSQESIENKVAAFAAGADDYVSKTVDFRELDARIKRSYKRQINVPPTNPHILTYADIQLDTHSNYANRAGVVVSLTSKESSLLKYLLNNPERIISRTEIADAIWNTHFNTGTNFIDVYINYLRKKLIGISPIN